MLRRVRVSARGPGERDIRVVPEPHNVGAKLPVGPQEQDVHRTRCYVAALVSASDLPHHLHVLGPYPVDHPPFRFRTVRV